jgi:hypothetical protein
MDFESAVTQAYRRKKKLSTKNKNQAREPGFRLRIEFQQTVAILATPLVLIPNYSPSKTNLRWLSLMIVFQAGNRKL